MRPSIGIINLANLRTMFGYLFEGIEFTANAKSSMQVFPCTTAIQKFHTYYMRSSFQFPCFLPEPWSLNCMKANLAKWLSICLRTKWLQVRILLLSLKLQIWFLFQARSFLTFRQITECRFTMKPVCDIIRPSQINVCSSNLHICI